MENKEELELLKMLETEKYHQLKAHLMRLERN